MLHREMSACSQNHTLYNTEVYSVDKMAEFRVLTDAQQPLVYLKLVNTLERHSAVIRRYSMIQEYMNSNFIRNKLIFHRIHVKLLRYF